MVQLKVAKGEKVFDYLGGRSIRSLMFYVNGKEYDRLVVTSI
ncbi:hypothetical protein QFZ94_008646 [Paraburkholderia sp. JPY465]